MIKPIYQTDNQYSKLVPITYKYQFPRIKGKYFAFCEGDDYWTDPYKLQRQVELLEKHSDIDIVAHDSISVDARTGRVISRNQVINKLSIIPVQKVIIGGGNFVATASLLQRTQAIKNMKRFMRQLSLDYSWQINGSLHGGMIYIPKVMSAYRENVVGSWTHNSKNDIKANIVHRNKVISMLEQLDDDTNNQYHKVIKRVIYKVQIKKTIKQIELILKKLGGDL